MHHLLLHQGQRLLLLEPQLGPAVHPHRLRLLSLRTLRVGLHRYLKARILCKSLSRWEEAGGQALEGIRDLLVEEGGELLLHRLQDSAHAPA